MKYYYTHYTDIVLAEFPDIKVLPDLDINSEKTVPFMSCVLSELLGQRNFSLPAALEYLEKIKSGIPSRPGTLCAIIPCSSGEEEKFWEGLGFHELSASLITVPNASEKYGINKLLSADGKGFMEIWDRIVSTGQVGSVNSRSLIYLTLVYILNKDNGSHP